jgi:hypothetical protein
MEQDKEEIKTRGRGRPKKGEIVAKKSKNRGTLGRPKGDKAIIDEYKARMLNSPKSAKVLETILNAALTDGHPGQTAAWKLVADRIIPVSAFEQSKQGSSAPSVIVNITGLGQSTAEVIEDDVTYDISDVEIKDQDD